MAPEQLEGKAAIGAERRLRARARPLRGLHRQARLRRLRPSPRSGASTPKTQPAPPSSVTSGIDPVVERVILRCLEKDPKARPASALQVASALPGGDPLAAALAAGETPSPEMVAAAGEEGTLAAGPAWALLGGVVVSRRRGASHFRHLEGHRPRPSREVPSIRSRTGRARWPRRLGWTEPPADSSVRLRPGLPVPSWNGPARHRRLGAAALFLVVDARLLPLPTEPAAARPRGTSAASVRGDDPAMNVSGMVTVTLDTRGRLRSFLAVPRQLRGRRSLAGPAGVGGALRGGGPRPEGVLAVRGGVAPSGSVRLPRGLVRDRSRKARRRPQGRRRRAAGPPRLLRADRAVERGRAGGKPSRQAPREDHRDRLLRPLAGHNHGRALFRPPEPPARTRGQGGRHPPDRSRLCPHLRRPSPRAPCGHGAGRLRSRVLGEPRRQPARRTPRRRHVSRSGAVLPATIPGAPRLVDPAPLRQVPRPARRAGPSLGRPRGPLRLPRRQRREQPAGALQGARPDADGGRSVRARGPRRPRRTRSLLDGGRPGSAVFRRRLALPGTPCPRERRRSRRP